MQYLRIFNELMCDQWDFAIVDEMILLTRETETVLLQNYRDPHLSFAHIDCICVICLLIGISIGIHI